MGILLVTLLDSWFTFQNAKNPVSVLVNVSLVIDNLYPLTIKLMYIAMILAYKYVILCSFG